MKSVTLGLNWLLIIPVKPREESRLYVIPVVTSHLLASVGDAH